jgi:hypothetical protein
MLRESDEASRLQGLAMAYHALGRDADSDAAMAQLEQKHGQTALIKVASAHAFRGEKDLAFAWLDRALQANDPDLGAIAHYPRFNPLHDDPRWLPILRRVGIAPEQLSRMRFNPRPSGVALRGQ